MTTSIPSTTTAIESLRARGVADHVAGRIAADAPATLVNAWCEYAGRQRRMGPGAVIDGIRSGAAPPAQPRQTSSTIADQATYAERIHDWLVEKMPDVCRPNPKVIEWERRLYGDALADRMANRSEPHYAAIAAVIRLHYQLGKGWLTVTEHGPEIRAAVRRAHKQAIADYQAIAEKRELEQRVEACEGEAG